MTTDAVTEYRQQVEQRKTVSYLLCLLAFVVPVHGLHRIYNGKTVTGLIWFFTLGLFYVGQIVDLLSIPRLAEEGARRDRDSITSHTNIPALVEDPLRVRLLKIAQAHQGKLSVTRAVMETGADFDAVEAQLKAMVKAGYAVVTNDPSSGIVLYEFPELA